MIKGIGRSTPDGPSDDDALGALRSDAVDVLQPCWRLLDDVEHLFTERLDQFPQKAIREIMIFLHSHGVGMSRAVRIFKTYGADAIRLISGKPLPAGARHPWYRLQERRLDRLEARHREDGNGDEPGPRRYRLTYGFGELGEVVLA